MEKDDVIQKIHDGLLMGVVRGDTLEDNLAHAKAYIDGGVRVLEISAASTQPIETIARLKQEYGNDVVVGAGTVLDDITARLMMLSGADFIAAPTYALDVARICNRYQVLYLPTCFTSNEIADALEHGLTLVKLFPGELYPASVANVLQKMYHGMRLISAGGANIENIEEWLSIGIWGVGLVFPSSDLDKVTADSRVFVDKINKLKAQ